MNSRPKPKAKARPVTRQRRKARSFVVSADRSGYQVVSEYVTGTGGPGGSITYTTSFEFADGSVLVPKGRHQLVHAPTGKVFRRI